MQQPSIAPDSFGTLVGETPSFKTKITRGTTGGYGWEMTIYGAHSAEEAGVLTDQAIASINNAIYYADKNIFYPEKKK